MVEELRVPCQIKLVYVYYAAAGVAADSAGDSLFAEFESGDGKPCEIIENGVEPLTPARLNVVRAGPSLSPLRRGVPKVKEYRVIVSGETRNFKMMRNENNLIVQVCKELL